MGYCIYTGASVTLEDVKKNNDSAHATMRTFLRALNTGMRRCRLLERSLNIIIKEMSYSSPSEQQSLFQGRAVQAESAPVTSGYIPAFPYIDPAAGMDLGIDSQFTRTELNSMQVLDCYPEMQMDLGGMFGSVG